MKRAIFIAVILAALTQVANAADENAAADALITKGLELRRQGHALEAIDLFQKANTIAPTPRSLGQLGLAEAAVQHWSDAEEHLDGATATPQDAWVKKNRAALDQAIALARTHIGQIALTGHEGAAIVISGKAAGKLPLAKPIRVNAGPALVTATAPGFKQFEMSIPVEAGKETQLKIELEPLQLASAPAPTPPVAGTPPVAPLTAPVVKGSSRSSWRTWTGVSLLAGGAGVAAWGIVWIVLDGHSSSGSCSANEPAGCHPVYNTKTSGAVLTGVGAAAAVTGGILLYTAKSHDAEVGVAVAPTSLTIAGRF
ncbi:MAG TPA: PEGA domain-containing protein [Polyangia bacterium]|nr:PEGA domain-containing protein [Polyangia bacterium]